MPITRTVMIDDDGSGTTGTIFNNAWKQELYDQIDGIAPTRLAWAPGATGIGTVGAGFYFVLGSLVYVTARLTWPANADASAAAFSLPVPAVSGFDGGLYQSYGAAHHRLWINNSGSTVCSVLNAATGATRTHQELSSALFIVHGIYARV